MSNFRPSEEKTTTEELIYEDDLDGNSTKRNLNASEDDIVYEYDYNPNPKPTSQPKKPENDEENDVDCAIEPSQLFLSP